MRRILSIVLVALVALGANRALAQQPEATAIPAFHGVTWTLDPVRGVMQATPAARVIIPGKLDPALRAAATATAATYTGTIDVTITVNLVSAYAKGTTLFCNAGVGLDYEVLGASAAGTGTTFGIGGNMQNQENIQMVISGTKATCSISIPYIWTVPASTATSFVFVQGITGSVQVSTLSSTTSGGVTSSVNRYTQVELAGPTTIPPDGTVTTMTATAVL